MIIDGYVNEHVLSLVSTKEAAVEVHILTRSVPAILKTAALAFQKQYGKLSIRTSFCVAVGLSGLVIYRLGELRGVSSMKETALFLDWQN